MTDPYRFPDDRDVLVEAVQRMLAELLTEPLKLHELAPLFRVPRKTMGAIVRNLERRGGPLWQTLEDPVAFDAAAVPSAGRSDPPGMSSGRLRPLPSGCGRSIFAPPVPSALLE
jgi:hypothetical protein